ncbi:hypothetical protein C4D60_Mb11t02170 [Musa balbisiana]|uniref:F-box domain-containing protein n=1 Tax=Musa balbisiana TaxID=52838 RepID=A0A4S8J137_MUSBA|nr:hypothetical protein C4D60_Mb11t02170 [Musa balbisiana]
MGATMDPPVALEEEMGATMDPPVALGPDIMMKILESSDARSVARRTLVSLRWHEIAPSDFLWDQKTAPEYWQNLNPSSMSTGPPIHSYFQPNGSQEADPDDKVWGGHECTYSIITSYIGKARIRDYHVRINKWPTMTMSTKEDWSWEMSNEIYCYNSVPDAEKEGGIGPVFPV